MNYSNLISLLSERSRKSESIARQDIVHVTTVIARLLSDGKKVTIPGLGTFSTKVVEAPEVDKDQKTEEDQKVEHTDRITNILSSDEEMNAAPKRIVEFSSDSLLNEKVNEFGSGDE